MYKRELGYVILAVVVCGCSANQHVTEGQSESASTRPSSASTRPASSIASVDSWGAPVQGTKAMSATQVFAQAEQYAGKSLLVEGKVESVCQKKGCWLTITDGEHSMRVTFKDYGFFVPFELSGSSVRAEGVFDIREVPVAEARHYLEDEGKPEQAKKIQEPQRSFVFEATGVALLN